MQAAMGWVSLAELKVTHNQLASLPQNLGHLSKLVTLHATANRITDIPPSIAGCRKLVELHLGQWLIVAVIISCRCPHCPDAGALLLLHAAV